MDSLTLIPEWLGVAVIGAVIAATGYVGKLIVESWIGIREAQNARRARLIELKSLLNATRVSFAVQNNHANRLLSMIRKTHPELKGMDEGYERAFTRAYSVFTPDEKELHAIIRSITIHSLRPVNHSLSKWLQNDTYFKAQKLSRATLGELAGKLAALEAHLVLWHAKYETWIPDTPEHSLVYLADEEEHGIAFPSGIDEVVNKTLA